MTKRRPPQITQDHLAKLALIYVRVSTAKQTRESTGSIEHQRDQRAYPLAWGWPEDRILAFEDLGLSGTRADNRGAFQRVITLVDGGGVGAVFVANAARLSREPLDFESLVALCRIHRTLLVIEGRVLDLNDAASRLMARIQGGVAEFENNMRIQNSVNGKYKKAELGIAITRPPTGYVITEKGKWAKDPDMRVREFFDELFRMFSTLGTVPKLLRHLVDTKTTVPVRTSSGDPSWVRPNVSRLRIILTHPVYAGYYVFGRRRVPPGAFKQPPRWTPPSEWTMVPHHEAYITPAQWLQNCERIHANAFPRSQVIGRGPALCQGLIWCGKCDYRMSPEYYSKRDDIWIEYRCRQGYEQFGQLNCWTIASRALDRMVAHELLRALQPPDIEAILDAGREVNHAYDAAGRRRQQELQDAQYQVRLAKKRFDAIDPENHRLLVALADEREQAMARLQEVEFRHRQEFVPPPLALTPEQVSAIHAAAQDLPQLWSAPTTTPADKKELLRHFVQRIRLMAVLPAYYDVEIDWKGGATTAHRIARLNKASLVAFELRSQGWNYAEIAAVLNCLGFTRRGGEPFTAERARYFFYFARRAAERGKTQVSGSSTDGAVRAV